jgi:Domain of unknown function (DUF4270)
MTKHTFLRKKLLYLLFCSIPALLLLQSCQKQPELIFGNTYVNDNSGANIVVVDTSTVLVTTEIIDSVATSGTGYHFVGTYNDPWMGQVSSRSFFQVRNPTSLPTINPIIDTYDSIGMIFFAKPGSPYYGDTTQFQNLVVNQVDTLYQLPNFYHAWYSNYTLPLGPVIGQTSIRIFPNRPVLNSSNTSQDAGDTVRIRLDDNLGQTIYNMVYNKSDTVTTPATWVNWFNGLCLSPAQGTTANIIDGLKDSCIMRIYYFENSDVGSEKFIDFPFYQKTFQFNNITYNPAGRPLANLILPTQNPQIPPLTPSPQIGNAGYVSAMEGLSTILYFPFLSSIALRSDYIGLLRATLTVRPVPGSFNQAILRPPPAIGIYYVGQNNIQGTAVGAIGATSQQTGSPVIDYFDPLNTVYTYDVTNYVSTQIENSNPSAAQQGLMLAIPTPANVASFNRLILTDQSYPISQQIQLTVYYISLYPHL